MSEWGRHCPKDECRIKEQADHNLKYLVAVALLDGEVWPGQFTHERIERDDVQALLHKVLVGPNAWFPRRIPQEMPVAMTVQLADGRIVQGEKAEYGGFHTRPISWDEVQGKFERLTRGTLDPGLLSALVAAVRSIETLPIGDLTALLGQMARTSDRYGVLS